MFASSLPYYLGEAMSYPEPGGPSLAESIESLKHVLAQGTDNLYLVQPVE